MIDEKKEKEITIRIPSDVYSAIENTAKKEGFSNLGDYILHVMRTIAREKPVAEDTGEKLRSRLERYIQDEINKRLQAVDNIKKQIADIYEKIEEIENRLENLESSLRESAIPQSRREPTRKSGMDRLREEKIVFESRLPSRIQRDRLFSYFERMGAIVLKLSKERIAIDPDYWREFKYKLLNDVVSNKEEDILNTMGQTGFELWKALYSDNMIIFDPKSKRWRFITPEIP